MDFISDFGIIFSNVTLHWVKNHGKFLESNFMALKSKDIIR
jgi:trans-aconitate methyltransferase